MMGYGVVMGLGVSEVDLVTVLLALVSQAGSPDVVGTVDQIRELRVLRRAANPPPIPPVTYEKVAGGQTVSSLDKVEGLDQRAAWGVVLVPQPIGRVWSAVNDFSDRTDYSKVDFSEVQHGEHCGSGRQVFQYLPIGFPVSDRWWVSTLRINHELRSKSDGRVRELYFSASTDPDLLQTDAARAKAADGVPVGRSEGGWFLADVGGTHTLLEYHAYSEPGGSVPTSFANAFATSGVKSTLEAVVKLADADPRCP